jgi:hypothetical protein
MTANPVPEDDRPWLLLACRPGFHDGTLAGWTPVAAWQMPATNAADLLAQAAQHAGENRMDPAGFTIEGTDREFARLPDEGGRS